MNSEQQARIRLRVLYQANAPGVVGFHITTEKVPDKYREQIRTEVELHRHAPQYKSIANWWWEPRDKWLNDRPEMEVDRFKWLVDEIAKQLTQEFGCTIESADKAATQLLEAELGGPLFPAEGPAAFLTQWMTKE